MQPFFTYSVPHPYKLGVTMRPREAVRLPLPCGGPGRCVWVTPAFFAYAQTTPGWYAEEVQPRLQMMRAISCAPLNGLEMMHMDPSGNMGMGLGYPAAKGGSHD
jgi:hypothetical protein